jgi:NRPS condensation-like uncharacterized protein
MTDSDRFPAASAPAQRPHGTDPAATHTELPLAFNQEKRLLLEELARIRSVKYPPFSIPFILRLEGRLNLTLLQKALNEVIHRHSVLRTAFLPSTTVPPLERQARLELFADSGIMVPGLYRQSILPEVALQLHLRPLDEKGSAATNAEIERIVNTELDVSFDYAQPPLIRAILLNVAHDDHYLILIIHHLVADLWSLRIMREELELVYAFYLGVSSYPAKPSVSYADFAASQHTTLNSPAFHRAVSYWKQQWSAFEYAQVHYGDLPFALPRPSAPTFAQGFESIVFDLGRTNELRNFARAARVTLYMLFLTAFSILLHIRTRKRSVAVWGNFRNRTTKTERVIGWLANSHLMGLNDIDDATLSQLLSRARDMVLQTIDHQQTPLVAVWPVLERRAALSDLHILFDLIEKENKQDEELAPLTGLVIREADIPGVFMQAHGGLAICAVDSAREICLQATYSRDRFSSESIRDILAGLRRVLDSFLVDPAARVSAIIDAEYGNQRPALRAEQDHVLVAYGDWQLTYQTDWGS